MEQIIKGNERTVERIRTERKMEEKIKHGKYDRPILEMKAVLDIGILGDDKGYYPVWARDMANTLDIWEQLKVGK